MNIHVDQYVALDTGIHRWNPRAKFIGIMILMFSFSYIKSVKLIPLMVLITGGMFLASKLPVKMLLARWKVPSLFIIVMSVFLLLFSQGKVLLDLSFISVTLEGLESATMVLMRAYCILTLAIILFETVPFLTMLKAMNSLGLPDILSDLIIFTYRYIFQLAEDLSTMQTSMKLRGFKGKRLKDIIGLVFLVGTIFIRSYEQSERIYGAMLLRGYSSNVKSVEKFSVTKSDLIYTCTMIIYAGVMIVCQIYITTGRI